MGRKADEDIGAVAALLAARPPLQGSAAYHCQQAAEKLIKAVLIASGVPFRKTHDPNELETAVAGIRPGSRH